MEQDTMTKIFETAKKLLEISYDLRDADILPEIGREVTILADKTLKVLEETPEEVIHKNDFTVECAMPDEMPKQDGMCGPGECQCCDDERNKCHGHSNESEVENKTELPCNGHNAMGPGAEGSVETISFPSGNSSPEIDNEINELLNKVKGQIDGK